MSKKDKLAYKGEIAKYGPKQQREIFGNAIKFHINKKYWDSDFSDVEHRLLFGRIEVHHYSNIRDFDKGFSELKTENIIGKKAVSIHIELLKDINYFNRAFSCKKLPRRVKKKHITRIMNEYKSVMRLIAFSNKSADSKPDKGITYFSSCIKKQFIENGR